MVVVAAIERPLHPAGGFHQAAGDFDIARFGDAQNFSAHSDWIADVFEGVRANREVELLVLEGPRRFANIALEKRFLAKALVGPHVGQECARPVAGGVGHDVDDIVRAVQRRVPPPDV